MSAIEPAMLACVLCPSPTQVSRVDAALERDLDLLFGPRPHFIPLPIERCTRCHGPFCRFHQATHLCMVGDEQARLPAGPS